MGFPKRLRFNNRGRPLATIYKRPEGFRLYWRQHGADGKPRRPQLRMPGGLWDTSEQLCVPLGAKANTTALEWTFPSGATIRLAGMEHEADRFGWRGAQVPFIAFDKLCQFTAA